MKAEFYFSVNDKGEPVIGFKHHDRDNSLEQKLLGIFVKKALANGIKIGSPGGMLEAGTNNSWEEYKIEIKTP